MRPIARTQDLVIQEIENECLVYDTLTNKVACLNETSASVWMFCNGRNSITEISKLMSDKFSSKVNEDFIWLTLEELSKNNLLKISRDKNEFSNYFRSISRREVIRKVGLASIIALPLISTITAPQAVSAQSTCVGVLGACTSDPQCCATRSCRDTVMGMVCCILGAQNSTEVPCSSDGECCTNVCDTMTGQCII